MTGGGFDPRRHATRRSAGTRHTASYNCGAKPKPRAGLEPTDGEVVGGVERGFAEVRRRPFRGMISVFVSLSHVSEIDFNRTRRVNPGV